MSHNLFPNPDGVSWFQWASTVAGNNTHFGQYVRPEMSWQEYARGLTYLEPATPRPEWFSSWQDWVIALKRAISR